MHTQIAHFRDFVSQKTKKFRHYLPLITFTAGFVLDLFTLNRIDQQFDMILLGTHLFLATFWICLLHLKDSRFKKIATFVQKPALSASFALQFSFGALFSGFVIFYTKSASLFISWPFLIFLYILFLGNEAFRKFYEGKLFHIFVWFFSLFTMLIFLLPIVLKQLSVIVFLFSGILSLVIITAILFFFFRILQSISSFELKRISALIIVIFSAVHVLYFKNIIPPIPLSLKDDGVYYQIYRSPGGIGYDSLAPQKPFWEYLTGRSNLEKAPGQNIYYFSSVFAPSDLSTGVIHQWELQQPTTKQWRFYFEQEYSIMGGRDSGYRGYSYVYDPPVGKWRVKVKNFRGQVLGIKHFTLSPSEIPPVMLPEKL